MAFFDVLPSRASFITVFEVTGWYLSVFFHRVIEVNITGWHLCVIFHLVT